MTSKKDPRPEGIDENHESITSDITFRDLNLAPELLSAIEAIGYESPSPIQAQAIPPLLAGLDLIGRAPTGTGKTAAFALPLLSRIDVSKAQVQVMVLAPTRELAIQVSEAFLKYASHMKGFHVLPIYGGQDYSGQLRQLRRGVHVVVGTPGRVMDHMRKGTLKLDGLQALVLDEADEMLRMGFIDDVEWVLEQIPDQRQMALFSATMPKEIQRIARKHLRDPQEVSITTKTATAATIRQRYWQVSGLHKLDALTRILEVEPFDAMLIFVRTRVATAELANKLEARGYACAPLNGDMAQSQREQMINRLKNGQLDILIATDVAARGLDVERISHVVNYDIPNGTESYIHRIGRTGRAGKEGDAILFVAPRERGMLANIERATRQKIERLELPTVEMVSNKRISDFKQAISDTLASEELDFMRSLLESYQAEHNIPAIEIAAALSKMAIGDRDLVMAKEKRQAERSGRNDRDNSRGSSDRGSSDRGSSERGNRRESSSDGGRGRRDEFKEGPRENESGRRKGGRPGRGMERYRIEVGYDNDVKPGNIVGAIANEAGLDSQYIGHIEIQDDHTLVDLPKGMPFEVLLELKKVWVCGKHLDIAPLEQPRSKPKAGG
ncbi:DEAD/DEAH box helicase, partial [bacterium]|nr:DEAD/DEAH box helicase [bacterium]